MINFIGKRSRKRAVPGPGQIVNRYVFLVAMSFSMTLRAAAQDTDTQKMRFGCVDPIEFGYVSPDPGFAPRPGIDLEVISALSKKTGCRIDPIVLPPARILGELASGRIAMSSRWFETPERTQSMWFAHYQRSKNLAVYKGDRMRASELAQLRVRKDLLVGVVRGFRYGDELDTLLAELEQESVRRLVQFSDRRATFEGLLQDRVQVIFLPREIFGIFSRGIGPSSARNLKIFDILAAETAQPGGLALSKARFNATQAEHWEMVVDELCRSGKILEIFRRYFPAEKEDLACQS